MMEIILKNKKTVLVNNRDYKKLIKHKWKYCFTQGKEYVYTYSEGKRISMHRYLLNPNADQEVDHVNGNGLDNRKKNLRRCSHSQNMMNRKINKNNKSGYKGVCYRARINLYYAYISVNSKTINLGHYKKIKDAALAYNTAAQKFYGKFASINTL